MSDMGKLGPPAAAGRVPDFTHEALAHLQIQSDEFALHVQAYLNEASSIHRKQLDEDLHRFRNTLVLLEKGAAVYVAEELIALLKADAQGLLTDHGELTRVLMLAADQLSAHVALLQKNGDLDNALPLLPLVNDSRACRDESLLSDALVLAAGIELPVSPTAAEQHDQWILQRREWVSQATQVHMSFARSLLHWWRVGEPNGALALVTQLDELVSFCSQRACLSSLVPLFQSASLVASAIAEQALSDGPALRSLFAQLERHIHRSARIEYIDDLLPGDLLRNYLYYVAQIESDGPTALGLRRQFRLDRVRQAARVNDSHSTPTIGVGYHLARAIRSNIAVESEALRHWLNESPTNVDQPRVVRLRVRLAQLEPVLTLMGEPEALVCLQSINADLALLEGSAQPDSAMKHRLAQSLLTLDALLDNSARHSIKQHSNAEDLSELHSENIFVNRAIDACLRVARDSLQEVANTLGDLLPVGALPAGQCQALTREILRLDLALQLLPLPLLSPLLQGLSHALTEIQRSGRGPSGADSADHDATHNTGTSRNSISAQVGLPPDEPVQQELATLLVSIDYYLGCVLQPHAAADQLLLDARSSLQRLTGLLSAKQARVAVVQTQTSSEPRVATFLPHMDALGTALVTYRHESGSSVESVRDALQAFARESAKGSSAPLQQLSSAAFEWFEKRSPEVISLGRVLSADELATLDEIHGVIPQLIDQWLSDSESIRGFDELIDRLTSEYIAEASADPTNIGTLTLNVDDDLLSDSMDGSSAVAFDNTLQHVFYHECIGHLDDLQSAVQVALQPSAAVTTRLPTEQMLRALHTLTGSAQNADAHRIVSIVQPLQRAALAKQRLGESFDATQTRYIGDLIMALRAHLDSLTTGHPVAPSVRLVEQQLTAFLAAAIPGSDGHDNGLSMAPNVRSIDDVFTEEASELLERLRLTVYQPEAQNKAVQDSLSMLHTLKGSAHMAGRTNVAETAHALESQVQDLTELQARMTALKVGYLELNNILSQVNVRKAVAVTEHTTHETNVGMPLGDTLQVSDSAFDTLLDLATDATVNQARLSDELARLREVYQDLETTTLRFSELMQSNLKKPVAPFTEMFADLDAARDVMRRALRQAEREQQQASRASAGLQQSLIRNRLIRVDETRERLTQIMQDAAQTMNCEVTLVLDGGEVTLDRVLFRQLQAPLEHLTRNAIVHGIEPAAERIKAGKSAAGQLTLSAQLDGTDLVISFSDDGRGIDKVAVSALLEARGESPVETLEDLQRSLFSSGFSSVESPTALAGHGLGLFAVQAAVEQLRGHVQLSTEPGVGLQITMRIPQRIVVNQVVLVESEGSLFALPVSQVDAVRLAGVGAEIPTRYHRVRLAQLLSQSSVATKSSEQTLTTILVSTSGESLALEVDLIIGYRELVTQALGPQLSSLCRFTGGSVLSDGRQVLIVDLNRVTEMRSAQHRSNMLAARESLRPVALIVDDSLTMRVAAQTVLQRCGIAVRQSRDGIEALDSMALALPNLIILDIEMPRLDGRDFLKRVREQYGDACPPVIVTSSRDDATNRDQMAKLGAVRFLTKPYTDAQLLDAIESAGLRLPDLTIA